MNGSNMRYKSLEHALSIADVYFTIKPKRWLYEPHNKFKVGDKKYQWRPDFVMAHEGKIYCGEYQSDRSPMSKTRWEKKWIAWNLFFKDPKLYGEAEFQKWSKNPPHLPHFICITKQEGAAEGFNVSKRKLQIISNINELL